MKSEDHVFCEAVYEILFLIQNDRHLFTHLHNYWAGSDAINHRSHFNVALNIVFKVLVEALDLQIFERVDH